MVVSSKISAASQSLGRLLHIWKNHPWLFLRDKQPKMCIMGYTWIYVTTSLQRYACWEIHARTVSPTKDLDILSVGFHSVAYPHIDFDIAEPLIKWLMFPHILLSIKGHTRPGRHDRNKVRFSGQKVTAAARTLLWWCWCQMMWMFSSGSILLQSNGSFLPAVSDAVLSMETGCCRILEADLESSEAKADSSAKGILSMSKLPLATKE